jgi:hypothetical protein
VSFLIVRLSILEVAFIVATVGKYAGAFAVGKAAGPRPTVVSMIVGDKVGLVLTGTAAAAQGVALVCVGGDVR